MSYEHGLCYLCLALDVEPTDWAHARFEASVMCSHLCTGRDPRVQGLRQAESEFYLWTCSSDFPFCQVITDVTTGGVAYYCAGDKDDGGMHLHVRVFMGMEPLYEFLAKLIEGLPKNLGRAKPGTDDQSYQQGMAANPGVQEFAAPRRVRPRLALGPGSGSALPPVATAMKLVCDMRAAEDDVACLRDVQDSPFRIM